MAIRAGRVTRDVLLDAALPTATATYTVISHGFVINTAKQMLHDKGFNVVDEKYTALDGAQVACGAFHINYGDDPELGMLFAFANSYDKSLKFSCAIGAYVKTNDTSILSKDGSGWVRMHTGAADQEASDVIEKLVDNAEAYFQQLQADKEIMKQIKVTKREYGELLGRLFIDLKILGMEQLSSIKKEFEKPSYKYASDPDSLWALYNHILIGISKANPKTWMEQQKIIHFHLMDEFELTVFDEEETTEVIMEHLTMDDLKDRYGDDIPNIADLPQLGINLVDNEFNDVETPEEVEPDGETQEEVHVTPKEEPVAEVDEISPEDVEAAAEKYDQVVEETKPKVPKPTISMKEAVEKYADLITEDEGKALLAGEGSEEALNKLKAAYMADQAKAEEVLQEIVTDQVKEVLKEEFIKDAVLGTTHLPLTEERFKELDSAINAGAMLPPMPGKTPEAKIETPEVEDVVEDVSKESEVDAGEEFFMTKQDLDEMNEGVELEVGFVVTIGEDDCEITSITDDSYGLMTLTEPEEEVHEAEAPEGMKELMEEIEEDVAEVVNMDFEIGDAEENAPAETMLRTGPNVIVNKVSLEDEEQAKIDEALEVMNSKIELTKEERAAKAAIAMELEELYGVAPEFTYKLSNGEYTVTLDTDEVVVLTEDYIKSLEV